MPEDPTPTPAAPAEPAAPAPAAAAGSVPAATPAPAAPAAPAITLDAIIPEKYKDSPMLEGVKDIDGLFNKVDFLSTKVGERPAGIPQDTASDEEWQKFNKSWGVPEKAEDYDLGEVPEGLPVDDDFQKQMKDLLHKAGVSPRQLKTLAPGYNELLMKQAEAQKGKMAEMDKQFTELTDKTFGADKEKALKTARALMSKYTPEGMKPFLGSLTNEQLVIMASTLNGVAAEFIDEDKLPVGGETIGPQSAEQKREEGRKLMASEAYTNPFHPEHDATVKKVNELYGTGG